MNKSLYKQLIFLLAIGTFFIFTVADSLIKYVGYAYPPMQIFAIDTSAALMPVIFYLWITKNFSHLKTRNYFVHIVRGGLNFTAYYTILQGIILLPLSIAYPIILSSPVILIFFGIVILKEQLTKTKILSLLIAIIGVFLITGLSLEEGLSAKGITYLMIGAFAIAGLDITVRTLGKNEKTSTLTFYSILFSAILFTLLSLNNFQPMLLEDFSIIVVSGILDGFAIMLIVFALRRIEASTFGFSQYSQLLFGALIGLVIFGHKPSLIEVSGAILIVMSGYLVFRKIK